MRIETGRCAIWLAAGSGQKEARRKPEGSQKE
jgi:hypothetical protein